MNRSGGLASDVMVATTQEPTVMEGMQRQPQSAGQPAYTATPAEAAVEAAPPRQTYKSCTFCAKRKRACDSQRPRCSLCIEKKQPYCHYPLKPLPKRAAAKPAAARRLSSSSPSSSDCSISSGDASKAKRLAEAQEGASYDTGGVLATVNTRSMPTVRGRMSLKRCRLSSSPATGLVGMPENGFLCDFFGCFGILPLTTESTVRNAMVEVMMRQCGGQAYSGTGGSGMEGLAEDEEKDWHGGGALARRHTLPDHPAKCMMWCAIALGALMRGISVEHVMGYVQLAWKSLTECFDGRSVEHARAYLIMSFLHRVIGDEDKNERYMSFAVNIVSKLRPEDVPKELGLMLMTTDKLRVSACNPQPGDDLSTSCDEALELPQVREAQHPLTPTDVTNVFLVADGLLSQAFIADMTSAGAIPASGGGAAPHEEKGEPVLGESYRELGGGGVMEEGGKQVRSAGVACDDEELANRSHREPDVPPTGPAMKRFAREALPEMTSLAKTLESSDTCSGVGGVLYHGNVAYMRAIAGDLDKSFESLQACVDVVLRYPGLVRFRSHLIHCMLAASHFFNRRDMYDAMRGVYNSVGPMGYPQIPPYEEWRTIRQVCPHVMCRSMEAERLQRYGEGPVQTNAPSEEPVTSEPSPGSMTSPLSGADSQSSGAPPEGLASEEQGSLAPTTATGATAVSSPLPDTPHTSATFVQDVDGNDGAATGDMPLQRGLVATAMPIPELVYSAKGEAGGVRHAGWSRAAATGEQVRSSTTAPAPGSPKIGFKWWGGEVVSGGAEMNMTDADLLDIAAAFANDEGLLEEL
ncbi:conserved unknown protein [Ectocarpus siliculosus]|uniref:Zn(2)-C6 fungal-type domain-containing protein n=1 Tax=Ectocarpus siliculosus TaxID=2880 RepID=D7FTE0_ECTSI|nr:conserved unknown protein [Ectocarpus siliculosus]|eukprot:CBJ48518.1 conserved unknown protein [Ectocarpus siliculosus]